MDCAVCEVRSSVGYCCDCSKLLCEECGTKCERCQKLICPDHVHVTSHGRQLCAECMRERDARRARRKAAQDEDVLAGDEGLIEDEERTEAPATEDNAEAFVLSGWQPTPPWKLSLYAGGVAFIVGFLLLVVPGFQGLLQPWMSIIAALVAAISIAWAAIGLAKKQYAADRSKCFAGIGSAIAALVLAGLAVVFFPGESPNDDALGITTVRGGLRQDELKQFRRQSLDKYKSADRSEPPAGE